MWYKRWVNMALLAGGIFLMGAFPVGGEDWRIYYVFSGGQEAQQRQSVLLDIWGEGQGGIRLIPVDRDNAGAVQPLPEKVIQNLDTPGDYAFVLSDKGRIVKEGEGRSVLAWVGGARIEGISTEVDESTWGKVKDLFK
jgi:hypothetical protein